MLRDGLHAAAASAHSRCQRHAEQPGLDGAPAGAHEVHACKRRRRPVAYSGDATRPCCGSDVSERPLVRRSLGVEASGCGTEHRRERAAEARSKWQLAGRPSMPIAPLTDMAARCVARTNTQHCPPTAPPRTLLTPSSFLPHRPHRWFEQYFAQPQQQQRGASAAAATARAMADSRRFVVASKKSSAKRGLAIQPARVQKPTVGSP